MNDYLWKKKFLRIAFRNVLTLWTCTKLCSSIKTVWFLFLLWAPNQFSGRNQSSPSSLLDISHLIEYKNMEKHEQFSKGPWLKSENNLKLLQPALSLSLSLDQHGSSFLRLSLHPSSTLNKLTDAFFHPTGVEKKQSEQKPQELDGWSRGRANGRVGKIWRKIDAR